MKKDAGSFAAKRKPGEKADPRIAESIKGTAVEGEFSCLQAEDLVNRLQVTMEQTGVALDLLGIRISRCQLGLFGYAPESRIVKPASDVSPDLEEAIRLALVNGRLPCVAAWSIAETFKMPRMKIAAACEALKLKVKPCQLGAF
ncbi:MAG: hypothetical protein CSYNP_03593 [Syntrophus sp. SKADARSKE-3]|nr:hypothetical protein [Syntrophus sp. SKADARSKE-3]